MIDDLDRSLILAVNKKLGSSIAELTHSFSGECSERTIRRRLKCLEKRGLIRCDNQRTIGYRIFPTDEGKSLAQVIIKSREVLK